MMGPPLGLCPPPPHLASGHKDQILVSNSNLWRELVVHNLVAEDCLLYVLVFSVLPRLFPPSCASLSGQKSHRMNIYRFLVFLSRILLPKMLQNFPEIRGLLYALFPGKRKGNHLNFTKKNSPPFFNAKCSRQANPKKNSSQKLSGEQAG